MVPAFAPPIPRPLSRNKGIQLKYIDDSTQAASLNLLMSLEADLSDRPRPLRYHERTQMKIKEDENVLQQELLKFQDFTVKNKLVINTKKCFVMLFTRSKLHAFPPEFHVGSSEILEAKGSHRILGVIVQNDLRWTKQVEHMVRKATRTTWVLRRMRALGVDQDTLVAFWKAEGLPCVALWPDSGPGPGPGPGPACGHGGNSWPVGAFPHPPAD